MVKGGSNSQHVDRAAAVVHLASCSLQNRIWFEYVESKANWSDGASRLLQMDLWQERNGFKVELVDTPSWPWESPTDQLVTSVVQDIRATLG